MAVAGLAGLAALAGFAVMRLAPAPNADLSGVRSTPFTGYPGQERAASFSPDGAQAVFARSGEAGENWDLYVKPIGEWTPTRLTDHPDPDSNPAWSPNGETIAFIRTGGDEGCRFMSMPAIGGDATFLRSCQASHDVDLACGRRSPRLYQKLAHSFGAGHAYWRWKSRNQIGLPSMPISWLHRRWLRYRGFVKPHLRWTMRAYVAYYNNARTHLYL